MPRASRRDHAIKQHSNGWHNFTHSQVTLPAHHMAVREKDKLGLLLGSLLICALSLLTSQKSFDMGTRDLPLLQPQIHKFCKASFKARNKCQTSNHSNNNNNPQQQPASSSNAACRDSQQQASQCEKAVQKAYRSINMGGCPHELRDVTLCELERCGGYHGVSVIHNHLHGMDQTTPTNGRTSRATAGGCVEHCQVARTTLETCVTQHVQKQLRHYGIQPQQG